MRVHNINKCVLTTRKNTSKAERLRFCLLFFIMKRYDWHRHMQSVPRLHLPSLEETLKRYVEYVEGIVKNQEELTRTKECAAAFYASERGAELHRELERRRDDIGDGGSYVSPFWDEMYLSGRYPVAVHSNPSVSLLPDPRHSDQRRRASELVCGLAKWWRLLREECLPPDVVPSRKPNVPDTPLCVTSYSKLLGTYREALPGRDELRSNPDARHVTFLRGSRMFTLDVIDTSGRVMDVATLENHVGDMLNADVSSSKNAETPLALLTSLPRDAWANCRRRLDADLLHRIDTSLFVLSLDTVSPKDHTAAIRQWMMGDGESDMLQPRWFDKLTVAVAPDGSAGLNFEHSPYDAVPLIRMIGDVYDDITGQGPRLPDGCEFARLPGVKPVELVFSVPGEIERDVLPVARSKLRTLCSQTDIHALTIPNYGSSRLKSWGMSPDGLSQVAFQLAFRAQHGENAYPAMSVYESVATNRFRHGRTEAGRTVTPASARFVRRAVSLMGTPLTSSDRADLKRLLREACDAHSRRIRDASAAKGVDRHLFSLYKIALEQAKDRPIPSLFQDPLWARLNESVLSTSRVDGTRWLQFISYGAVTPRGYGVPYMLDPDFLCIGLSSFNAAPDISGGFGGVSAADVGAKLTGTDPVLYGKWIRRSFDFLREICEDPSRL